MNYYLAFLIFEHIVGMIITYNVLTDEAEGTMRSTQVFGAAIVSIFWPVLWAFGMLKETFFFFRNRYIAAELKKRDEKETHKGN